MNAAEIYKLEANTRIPRFSAGDTVRVNFRIREGERERIQAFQGVVIRLNHGKGPAANFTVRRISGGIGIERIFPFHSPLIESLEITRYGSVRRAKLYYLRGLQGRAARIKEMNPAQRRRAAEAQAAAAARREEAALAAAEAEALEQAAAEAEALEQAAAEAEAEAEVAAAEEEQVEAVADDAVEAVAADEQPAATEEPAAEVEEQPVTAEADDGDSTEAKADEQPE